MRLTMKRATGCHGNAVALALLVSLFPACAPEEFSPTEAPESNNGRSIEVATTVAFTEGPTVDRDGTVYFTDIPNNRILMLSHDGELSTFRQPSNRANGLIFDSEWRLLACEGGDGTLPPRVTRTNMETGAIEVIADGYEGRPLHQPNDLTLDGRGRIYFTDRPSLDADPDSGDVHGVYRVDADGTIERILPCSTIRRPPVAFEPTRLA